MTKKYLYATGAAALTLGCGYADLARGGITGGPILLVIGYCILVPAAIWWWPAALPQRQTRAAPSAPSYGAAAAAGGTVLLLYLLTLSPGTALWDTSEYIAAAYTVGIPHPPGNPLFVILGRVFALLPIAPGVAARINVLAALCSAVAAAMWFLVTERVTTRWLPRRWQQLAVGGAGALIGATAFTVWNQSIVNEKVYTVSLMGIAICSWLMIRWADDPDAPKASNLLVMAAYLMGLGYSNHMAGFLAAPAAAIAVLAIRPRYVLRWRLVLAALLAIGVGMSVFATQPIRAAYLPPINEGEVTACTAGQGFALDCTFTRTTWERFKYNFNREQYGKPPLSVRQAPFSAQLDMWWTYFRWQWLRDAHSEHSAVQTTLALLFLTLGLVGGVVHHRHDRRSFWYFGPLVVTMSVVLVYYMNFKYGASQAPALGDAVEREVRDRDYFFIWSYSAWGVWAALGLAALWHRLARLGREHPSPAREATRSAGGHLAAAPVLGMALLPLILNWSTASRRGQTEARDFALDLLNSVEPYGVLIVAGDNDSFPLWYAQEVERVRRDVLVVTDMLLNTDWHLRQVLRRPVEAYDADRGPAIYRGRVWPRPDGPVSRMSQAEADSIPPLIPIRGEQVFRKAGLTARISPQNLVRDEAGTGYLQRSEVAILRFIAESWPARPVYFSRTSGDLAHRLGMDGHLVAHGFARKLLEAPPTPTDTVVNVGGTFVDVVRTAALWDSVYVGTRTYAARSDWVDRPSDGIAYTYLATGYELAAVLRAQGRRDEAAAVFGTVQRIAFGARLDSILPGGGE